MNDRTFDFFTARAASLSRRASLVGLGGAALAAAVVAPTPARAGTVSKKVKKKCKKQIGQCETSAALFCARQFFDLGACQTTLFPCCASFKNCKGGTAYECIVNGLIVLASAPAPS
ncbi:MAG TPA: hypothetical protein VEX37_06045 [Thermomicrobiales bacterium]|nr:hypothetical protein [Thermomicrobiales bacterium]